MEIRKCSFQDIDTLMAIATQSYREHYTYLWLDQGEQYMAAQFNADSFEKQLQQQESEFYLVYENKEPVGMLKLNLHKAILNYTEAEALEIERIYLLKNSSRKGVGRQVMDFVEDLAKNRGKQVIWLKAMDSSGAVKFYEKCGYQVIDRTALAIEHIIDPYRHMYVMIKEVKTPPQPTAEK